MDNISTVIIIAFGDLVFTICSWPLNNKTKIANNIVPFKINIIFLSCAIIVAALTVYFRYQYILEFGATYGAGSDFLDCMVKYKVVTTFDDPDLILVEPSKLLNIFSTIFKALAYIFIVVYFREKVLFRNNHWTYLLIMIIYTLNTAMTGGRSETFRYFTAIIFCWYFFTIIKYGKKHNSTIFRKLFVIGILIATFMVGFVYVIGRNDNDIALEDVARSLFAYTGAPIFNLDIYLSNPWISNKGIFGELTFLKIINWIGEKFDINKYVYAADLPFISFNGISLGNVYTTFYSFYYDFYILGVIVLTALMAVICSLIYKYAYLKNIPNKLYFGLIFYAYMVNDIIMLPFANRVFDSLLSIGSWYVALITIILIKIFNYINKNKKVRHS